MSGALFENFNFSDLDLSTFKEEGVREDIIAPLLRKLGYLPSGPKRVDRGKRLVNPFLMVGTKKREVTRPDYVLWSGTRVVLVLEAKGPDEDVLNWQHVGQAYSYAIHPEVRCEHFAICNGRELVVFHIHKPEPVFKITTREIDERWADVEKELSPELLLKPIYRDYKPDLGLHLLRSRSVDDDEVFGMPGTRIETISRLATGSYTAGTGVRFDGASYLVNYDFGTSHLQAILSCLAAPLREELATALDRVPVTVSVDFMIEVDFLVALGTITQGKAKQFDPFVPLVVVEILGTRLNRTAAPDRDVPSYMFSLRAAFERLRTRA